ncbi:hypothetical protein AGMMS49960_21790 [Betaproteobacteria bacterium]|nr:hypothetical protein AGMMS49960_21790 [Betaproteobacteria bacterium]
MFKKLYNAVDMGIKSVQSSLDSFFEGFSFEETLNDIIIKNRSKGLENNGLFLSGCDSSNEIKGEGEYYEYVNRPICPHCNAKPNKVNKKKFRNRSFTDIHFGKVTIKIRTYYCKSCNTWFETDVSSIVEPYSRTSRRFNENMDKKAETGRKSLRAMEQDLKIDNMSLSHQTINTKLCTEENTDLIVFELSELSGFYVFDEQHPKTNGKHIVKGTIVDAIQNKVLAVKFYDKVTQENTETFLNECIPQNKRIAITTDHEIKYNKPIEELGFIHHQKCIFHLSKIIDRKIKENTSKIKNEDELEEIKEIGEKIKRIFSTDNINVAHERLYKITQSMANMPTFLRNIHRKKDYW